MPIYEFVCNKCQIEFELRLSFSQIDSTALCPECYADAQRLTSSFACKTGGNIQAAEKPFRKEPVARAKTTGKPTRKTARKKK